MKEFAKMRIVCLHKSIMSDHHNPPADWLHFVKKPKQTFIQPLMKYMQVFGLK